MSSKFEAVMALIETCPLVGQDAYFNFVSSADQDENTSILTTPYGSLVKKYVDGPEVKKFQCEIRQVKPLSRISNTSENMEQIQKVQEFLDWINEQGRQRNFPDFGEGCEVLDMGTPDGVDYPSIAGMNEHVALYAFPFEITYVEGV